MHIKTFSITTKVWIKNSMNRKKAVSALIFQIPSVLLETRLLVYEVLLSEDFYFENWCYIYKFKDTQREKRHHEKFHRLRMNMDNWVVGT